MSRAQFHMLFVAAALVIVFEPAPALVRVGAGIVLAVLALEVLRTLGRLRACDDRRDVRTGWVLIRNVSSALVIGIGFAYVGATAASGTVPATGWALPLLALTAAVVGRVAGRRAVEA